jgi:hypothetical protein
MTDKVCNCQFCKDHQHLLAILPSIPEEHREFVKKGWENFWQADEELCYKKAVLDGSWPEATILLKLALANAEKKLAKEESELKFDCKVCEKCNKPMTSKEYWAHACNQPKPTYEEEVEEDPFYMGEHQGDWF